MNERIRELMIQSMIETGRYQDVQKTYEKFAELIVQECIKQGDTLAKHYIDTHLEQEQVMLLASIADYSNEIKQHFGVDE